MPRRSDGARECDVEYRMGAVLVPMRKCAASRTGSVLMTCNTTHGRIANRNSNTACAGDPSSEVTPVLGCDMPPPPRSDATIQHLLGVVSGSHGTEAGVALRASNCASHQVEHTEREIATDSFPLAIWVGAPISDC